MVIYFKVILDGITNILNMADAQGCTEQFRDEGDDEVPNDPKQFNFVPPAAHASQPFSFSDSQSIFSL